MLQRDRQIRTQVHQLADACLFAASFWLAYAVRGNTTFTDWVNTLLPAKLEMESIPPEMFQNVWWLYFALVPAAPLVLESQGFYNRPAVSSRKALIWPLLRGSLIVTLGIVVLLFFFKAPAPRGVAFIFIVFSCSLVWIKEEILMVALRSPMAKAQYKRRVIVAGTPTETNRLRQVLKARAGDDIEVVAEYNLVASTMPQLIELLHEHSASSVLVSAKHANFERVELIIQLCETEGVEAWLVADFFATQIARASFDEISGHPLIVFRSTPEFSWQMLFKQALDLFGALTTLIFIGSWLFPLIALAIKLTSKGPVMFRQQRSGLNGAPFSIYKFRTMGRQWLHAKRLVAGLKKGRTTGKLVREISVAAKMGGADPGMNPRLFTAVEKAKKESVTKDAIQRAINKGAGIGDEKMIMEHVVYEGRAPHNVPVIVEVYTDNVNRTAPEIRVLFKKGQLATSGSNKFLFDHVGLVEAHHPDANIDREAAAIEAGANEVEVLTHEQNDDVPEGAAGAKFICDRTAVAQVSRWIAANGWTVVTSEIGYVPKQFPELTGAQQSEVGEFLHELDEHDDVHRVWAAVK